MISGVICPEPVGVVVAVGTLLDLPDRPRLLFPALLGPALEACSGLFSVGVFDSKVPYDKELGSPVFKIACVVAFDLCFFSGGRMAKTSAKLLRRRDVLRSGCDAPIPMPSPSLAALGPESENPCSVLSSSEFSPSLSGWSS